MKQPKNSPFHKTAKVHCDFSRTDAIALIRNIKDVTDECHYVTVSIFKGITLRLIEAFLRGRHVPNAMPEHLLDRLTIFASRSKTPEATWFSGWVEKCKIAQAERTSVRGTQGDFINQIFPRIALPLDDFGFCLSSELGEEIAMVSLGGFFHVWEDVHKLRKHGIQVMEAATEIERSRSIVRRPDNTTVPENYSEVAVEDWQDQLYADSWREPHNPDQDDRLPSGEEVDESHLDDDS